MYVLQDRMQIDNWEGGGAQLFICIFVFTNLKNNRTELVCMNNCPPPNNWSAYDPGVPTPNYRAGYAAAPS